LIFRVDLRAQYLKYQSDIDKAISRVLNSGRYTLANEVDEFEKEFAKYSGTKHVISVADGTRAISLTLKALGIGVGDEVITTPATAIPTIGAIIEAGATPVFVDIDINTFLINLEKVSLAITEKTKAVIPVHLFGNVVDIPRLRQLVGEEISIIEDSAQAHGSLLNDQHVGTIGNAGTFSFYPTKNLGAYGDGGAIITNSDALADKLRVYRNHGLQNKDICITPGVNSRLDEIQAAILRAKLVYLDDMINERKNLASRYMDALPKSHFSHQSITKGASSSWHLFQTRFKGKRDELIDYLQKNGIQSNVYYQPPHHLQPGLKSLGYREGDFPNAEQLTKEAIALPFYPEMKFDIVDKICKIINDYICKK